MGPKTGNSPKAEVGFEPTTNGFAIRTATPAKAAEKAICRAVTGRLGATLGALRADWPELATVVEAWPELSEPLRAGVVALVRAATDPFTARSDRAKHPAFPSPQATRGIGASPTPRPVLTEGM